VRFGCSSSGVHVPGTVNAGVDGSFATYVGWTVPWEAPFALVAGDDGQLSTARRLPAHIGVDLPVGTAVPAPGARSDRLRPATFGEFAVEWTDDVTVIDVRRTEAWEAGHLEGARPVPSIGSPTPVCPRARCGCTAPSTTGGRRWTARASGSAATPGPWGSARESGHQGVTGAPRGRRARWVVPYGRVVAVA
jgi:hypothetical protein